VSRLTFRGWLRQQIDRDDPVGDIARDSFDDRGRIGRNWDTLAQRLHAIRAEEGVWAAYGVAVGEFLRDTQA